MDVVHDQQQNQLRLITEHARGAVATMARAAVPMTPENYAVFYAYAERRLPELNAFIDRLFAEKRPFTPELCTTAHDRFLNTADGLDAVREANEQLSRTLSTVRHDVGEARQITEDFGSVLREHHHGALGERDHAPSPGGGGGGRAERDGLAVEIERVLGQLNAIQSRLQQSEQEVAELKGRLAEAERDAAVDPLTGLANRRHLDQRLGRIAAAFRDEGRELGVLMADIDFFKAFNDQHGHGVGDQVLRLVGRVILDNVGPGDLAARYGGEEFAILLPGSGLEEALEVARRINRALADRPFVARHSKRRLGHVTLSIGVARLRPDEAVEDTLRRADRALYMAKHNGRNQVYSAESGLP